MAQFRQLKLQQLGLHEELQTAVDNCKLVHQLGADVEHLFQDSAPSTFNKTSIS